MAQLYGQPVLILKEGAQRQTGRDAQRNNIQAGRVIAETVRTTLGPKGMDKMLISSTGDIKITNDGVTILEEIEVEHPAAKMLVEVAKTQEEEVGDGTTTAVVIAGELLRKAEELLDQKIHPTTIVRGYRLASEQVQRILDEIGIPLTKRDKETLKKIAITSMTGKGVGIAKETLAEIAFNAVTAVAREVNGKTVVDIDDIKILKLEGGSIEDTLIVHGMILDKERLNSTMPKRVEKAKIALINSEMKMTKTEIDAKISISSPDQIQAFLDEEEKIVEEMISSIKKAGATVVFCEKTIEDIAEHFLTKNKIFAVKSVSKEDMKRLAKATGAKIVTNPETITESDLGTAELVEERKIAGKSLIFIEGCKDPRSVGILLRGGTEHVTDELEKALEDALDGIAASIEAKMFLPGGGAPEVEISKRLREYSGLLRGREQLAVQKFADAIEIIPRTLAENAGLDPVETIVQLRSIHEKDGTNFGLDINTGKTADMVKMGILEPLKVKKQAIKSASEAAMMLIRIDDVIISKELKEEKEEKKPGKK